MKILAFSGLATCGKTTAANAIIDRNPAFVRVSVAEPIRDMLVALGVTRDQLANHKDEPIEWLGGKTSRQLMQTLGTEWGRDMITSEIWLNVLRRRVAVLNAEGRIALLDDCRFDNEAEAVHQLGGYVIGIHREGLVAMNHASEKGVSGQLIDAHVFNRGSVLDLENAIYTEINRLDNQKWFNFPS